MQCTKRYELLNYSEYGTVVDNVLYSCNYTGVVREQVKEETDERTQSITKEQETTDAVKAIIKEKGLHSQEQSERRRVLCKCNLAKYESKNTDHFEEGWEGSAIVAHGSTLAFGCLMFVFNTINAHMER